MSAARIRTSGERSMGESEHRALLDAPAAAGLRVLVVDSALAVCLHISRSLRGIASTVIVRYDVPGALAALRSDPFDVVITGGVDGGPGLADLARDCARRHDVKHLITLGDQGTDPASRCLSADRHLPTLWYEAERCSATRKADARRVPRKPCTIPELRTAVLERNQREEA